MSRFLKEIGIIFILLALTLTALFNIKKPTNNIAAKAGRLTSALQIVNFGSSHGEGFNYDIFDGGGLAAYRGGNTLYYDLQNYKYLQSRGLIEEEATVVIPVSYFSFGYGENRPDRLPDDSFVNYYYNYLPPSQIYNYSLSKHTSLVQLRIQENFQSLFPGAKTTRNQGQGEVTNFKEHAIERAGIHMSAHSSEFLGLNEAYLVDFIQEVAANNQRPVLVTVPFHDTYNEEFSNEWLEENFFESIQAVQDAVDVEYFDYSDTAGISDNEDYFSDSDHLSDDGTRVFSEQFFADIL